MTISGRIAASTRLGFEDARTQRQLAEEVARGEDERQFRKVLALRKIAAEEQQHRDELGLRERFHADQMTAQDRARRDASNRFGMEQMHRDREVMDVEEQNRAVAEAMSDPELSPALRKVLKVRKLGVPVQPSAEMILTDAERAAAEEADLKRLEKETDIRARTEARYRPPQRPERPERHPVPGPDGKIIYLTEDEINERGGVPATPRQRPVSGAERLTRGFYTRMDEALNVMDQIEDSLTERDITLINNSPLPDLINNRLLSGPGQQYAQALNTYTEARLRKESGAAIPPQEFASDRRTIGRQAFDKPETIRQKRQTRRTTAEGLGAASGGAYEEYYGEPFRRGGGAGGGLKVRMQAPDGSIQEVDQSQVEHFRSRGAKVVGGR